jgi:hypothetical protein
MFAQLNLNWNADPNDPEPRVEASCQDLLLHFRLNYFRYHHFAEGDVGALRFRQCARYRRGPTNDEGWYRGQCRYTPSAPKWGEFYEIDGDDPLRDQPTDWHVLSGEVQGLRHYLFYFRDETFECLAQSWEIEPLRGNALLEKSMLSAAPWRGAIAIPYGRNFSTEEFVAIQRGLVPQAMEDKWQIDFATPHLFFSRSWTGFRVYRVAFEATGTSVTVKEALCAADVLAKSNADYQAALLDFLIANLLLGEKKPFPVPHDAGDQIAGLLQHHIAGTGYQETQHEPKRRKQWWAFWRP